MQRVESAWSVLPDKRHWRRWEVMAGDMRLGAPNKRIARALKAIVGGRIKRTEPTVQYVSRLVLLKLWGEDPEERRRSILLHSFWLRESEARQVAFKWELQAKCNQSAWLQGCYVLAGAVVARPFSAKDVPF